MSAWLDPLRRVLDTASAPLTFFFRDDDAGWEDERLLTLIDRFASRGVALDVAAIPAAVGPPLACVLRELTDGTPRIVAVHQHGYAHVNHEREGRKCEFGPSRPIDAQRRDLADGRTRLEDLLGGSVARVFTPPWNRCTPATAACLADLGFSILSRDVGAAPLGDHGLVEHPVAVDWCGRRGARRGCAGLGMSIAAAAVVGSPVGIMLHHAVMTPEDFSLVGELLTVISSHPSARATELSSLPTAPVGDGRDEHAWPA